MMRENAAENAEHTQQQGILENLSTAVLLFDKALRLLFMNPSGEEIFKQSLRHARGRSVHELVINPDILVRYLAQTLTMQQVHIHRGCELAISGGGEHRVNCTFTPISEGGTVSMVLVELRPVDHQLRMENEKQLIAQQQASHELIRGLAHEIKNPLGGLRGAAQLLEREIADPSLREYTGIIIGEADRLQALIDRMLGPNNLPDMQPMNIHEVLERVRQLVQVEAGDGLVFHMDYDPSLPNLYADYGMIEQAILNIVRNAKQALDGVGEITLRTRVLRNFSIGSHRYRLVVKLEIVDNGPGIGENMLNKIFYPMITSRPDGTGLGLSIAQNLVSRHHGLVECESAPGKTTFTILLPLE